VCSSDLEAEEGAEMQVEGGVRQQRQHQL